MPAADNGGGLYVDSNVFATVDIANSVISGNSAQKGGGLYLTRAARFPWTTQQVTLNSATAGGDGGGIYLDGVSNANITASSMFSANSAGARWRRYLCHQQYPNPQ